MSRKPKVDAEEFLEALEINEASMGEIAAHHVTCEEFGISEMEGYELIKSLCEPVEELKEELD